MHISTHSIFVMNAVKTNNMHRSKTMNTVAFTCKLIYKSISNYLISFRVYVATVTLNLEK